MKAGFDCFRAGIWAYALVFAGVVFQGTPAFAQANTARWGGDYDYITTRNARRCDRACEDDGRCRAWVFIRRSRQCRLKFIVPRRIDGADCCVSGVKGDGVLARGRGDSKRGRCAEYAEQAVEQGNRNLQNRCGLRGRQWHLNYNRHFNYCMDVRGRVRRALAKSREAELRRCEHDLRARREVRCDHLARIAVQQSRSNIDNGCGFSGPYWNTSINRQIARCKDERADRGRQTRYNYARFEKREDRLRRCIMRGGGARDSACDEFTKAAIDHYQRNLRYRCKLSSNVWNDNYDIQYNWCRSVNAGERAKRLDTMRYQIKRCKKRRGWKKIFKF